MWVADDKSGTEKRYGSLVGRKLYVSLDEGVKTGVWHFHPG
jgi:hypothetical protein